ncbi:hypothetical protein B0H13DRAFT_1888345 [Mycena leptocephala]|nr:hypothetical protein B0H13DRAFT_1888345 [Mycena leptocephala]
MSNYGQDAQGLLVEDYAGWCLALHVLCCVAPMRGRSSVDHPRTCVARRTCFLTSDAANSWPRGVTDGGAIRGIIWVGHWRPWRDGESAVNEARTTTLAYCNDFVLHATESKPVASKVLYPFIADNLADHLGPCVTQTLYM